MKKFFSVFLTVCLLVSLVGLAGCSLWGYDDDDDVTAPAATMSASGVVDIPGDGIGASNLRGAVTLASKLKAQAYTLAVGGAETAVGSAVEVSSTDGSYTVTFPVAAGYYFIKITSDDVATFKMLAMVGDLAVTDTTNTVNVDSTTTAVAIVLLQDTTTLVDPATVNTADVAAVKTAVETAITGTGDVNAVVPAIAVTGVTLNKTTAGIVVGVTETLTTTFTPSYATDKTVTWASTDTGVATVNNGVVTGVAAGVATISVTLNADTTKKAECLVTVTVAVTGVTLNKNTTTIAINASETLIATVAPPTATNKAVTWSSSNTAVATVDANGKVTALTAGTATITVTTADGSKTDTCVVTVPVATIGQTVTLSGPVTTGTTTGMQIKITGISAADETTLTANTTMKVTLPAGATNYDFTVNSTISGLVDGVVMTVNTTNLATFDSFNSLSFNENLPAGFAISVTQGGAVVASGI
ncbi:MAG: hypothetical protein A2W80_11420 [Candidatus Riflebacteria bacterium GWC2_50_8]|nr:MAG: hypothetical protein A2W80_11420 [Candidatus Riflebacteria bacterium GWC2_50_8]